MKRILLAEDEDVLRMLVVDTLEDEDYEVDEAADGMEAVQFLRSKTYDLIILDYMMPGYSGLEIIEKIKSSEINNQGKILVLSAKSQQFEQERILEAGADYFMAKPFSPLKLIEKIEDILHEAESLFY
ncbi:response regulator [Peribacillus sp. NPDC097895]|uniref:response regulator n=1 Tax=Peribacillus sp. NPDC097895 TaxID=3390619 RepID=UPI003D04D410